MSIPGGEKRSAFMSYSIMPGVAKSSRELVKNTVFRNPPPELHIFNKHTFKAHFENFGLPGQAFLWAGEFRGPWLMGSSALQLPSSLQDKPKPREGGTRPLLQKAVSLGPLAIT
jgi:hypothetical protein